MGGAGGARPADRGRRIEGGGPRGSTLISEDDAAYLLVGDETALPAIDRRLEELRPGQRAHVLIEVADAAEERPLATAGDARITWVHRGGLDDATLDAIRPAARDVHAWVACEIETARRLRARRAGDANGGAKVKSAGPGLLVLAGSKGQSPLTFFEVQPE